MEVLAGRHLLIFLEENTNFLMIMKTEHIMNTGGQMVRKGPISKLPRGEAKGAICKGLGKLSGGGANNFHRKDIALFAPNQ